MRKKQQQNSVLGFYNDMNTDKGDLSCLGFDSKELLDFEQITYSLKLTSYICKMRYYPR